MGGLVWSLRGCAARATCGCGRAAYAHAYYRDRRAVDQDDHRIDPGAGIDAQTNASDEWPLKDNGHSSGAPVELIGFSQAANVSGT